MLAAAITSFLVLNLGAVGQTPACLPDGARYELEGGRFYARFERVERAPSARRLKIVITSLDTKRDYEFFVNRGNGSADAVLAPLRGELFEAVSIYSVSDRGDFYDFFGDSETPAPAKLLMPKLSHALWYQAKKLSAHGTDGAEREMMPVGYFKRISCGAP